jgi:hypothetical protein
VEMALKYANRLTKLKVFSKINKDMVMVLSKHTLYKSIFKSLSFITKGNLI